MNTIVYHGSQKDREVIREFEFAYECDRPQGGVGINQRYLNKCHKRKSTKSERIWMTQVIITTPEMLVTDDFNELTAVEWELLVVDEAHRLKSHSSKLAVNLRDDRFVFKNTLLLTVSTGVVIHTFSIRSTLNNGHFQLLLFNYHRVLLFKIT
jgi:chromodomain-helicase-DNA-binding protein 7